METPAQEFLQLKEIREGIVLLKNGGLRGILSVSPVNFALKSDEEQSYIISAFQSFLNSLDFSCQIVMQSRRLNITPYLDNVRLLEERQTNELLKLQTTSYREFIQELVQNNQIMTKHFYAVVPYTIAEILGMGTAIKKPGTLGLFKKGGESFSLSQKDFDTCHNQLFRRMEFVALGLQRCEVEVFPMTSEEIIELLWSIYHPAQAESGHAPQIAPELLK